MWLWPTPTGARVWWGPQATMHVLDRPRDTPCNSCKPPVRRKLNAVRITTNPSHAGEITFFESSLNTVRAPLNVTVAAATAGGTTASFTWFFSADSGEMRCVMDKRL